MMIERATAANAARVSGTFKVMAPRHAGTKHWLYIWDQNRGDNGSWRAVMSLSEVQVAYWEDLITIVTGEIV